MRSGAAAQSREGVPRFRPESGKRFSRCWGSKNRTHGVWRRREHSGSRRSRAEAGEHSRKNRLRYDGLNRLTHTAIGSTCTAAGAVNVGYDALGNIASKSDIGSYSYPSSGSGSVRPHAVASIAGVADGLTNPKFAYDANGNLTCVSTGTGCTGTVSRTVALTSFNMAGTLTEGSDTIAFTYDADHARVTQTATVGGVTTVTIYANDPVSGAMALAVKTGDALSNTDYLSVDGQIVAQRVVSFAGAATWGSPKWNAFTWGSNPQTNWGAANWGSFNWSGTTNVAFSYFTLDHLGSVAVVTDQGGAVVQRLSYDPWGKQRNPNGTPASCGSISSPTTRGFTNQEQVPGGCLVNLNARLYDPETGRMMAPDPVIGSPFVPQQLNRYTYVLDNPLSLTDPTGLCFLGCFWHTATFRAVIEIAVATLLQQPWALAAWETSAFGASFGGLANAGIAGGISGAVGTGKLKGALIGAFQAVAMYKAGDILGNPDPAVKFDAPHAAAVFVGHGLVGGLASAAEGGRFESGFLAGGVSSLADNPVFDTGNFEGNVAVHAVAGGIGSALGGGKFENGAITGAFGYLFNRCMHKGCTLTEDVVDYTNRDFLQDLGAALNPNSGMLGVGPGGGLGWAAPLLGGFAGPEEAAAEGLIGAAAIGRAGEAAVRGAYDIGPRVSIDIVGGGTRIPDGLTGTTLSEVKNVQSLSYTQQLQDFANYAQQNGLNFDLYVRPSARLSSSVLNAEARGDLTIKYIPGAK